MEEYGYLYNKFIKDVKKFSNKPNLSIKNSENNYSLYLLIICIILFIIISKYC
jgi:hypothetical protein